MATPLPERSRGARSSSMRAGRAPVAAAAQRTAPLTTRHNWALYAFLFLLPLQNIQTGYLPKLPFGLNFLNVGFLLALIGAWRMRNHLTRWSRVHTWIWLYLFWSVVTLLIGYWLHPEANPQRTNDFKDSMLGVLLLFVVELSITDWFNLKRVILFMLLPLPYILRVAWAEHASVSAWHYSDDMRLRGTFSMLGANEFASFCVTVALMLFALLLAAKLSKIWRTLLIGGITCMVLGIVWAYSRTAYVSILAGALVIIFAWKGRWKMAIPVALALAVVPPLLPHSVTERFDSTHVEGNQVDESTQDRYVFWTFALREWEKHPIAGTGNYTFSYVSPYAKDTHNLYLRTMAEKGVIGIVILVGLLLSILRAAWRTFRDSRPDSVAHALGLGMLGAWLALTIANFWGDRFTYAQMIGYFWVFVALVLKARELAVAERVEAGDPAAVVPQAATPNRRHATPRRPTRRELLLEKRLASR